ncbi:hypothetical protein SAMN06295912_108147 [Sphingomonas laterariae]|uniref:Uncharacterized protein n=1 Tax=Edaphosphingomonas laterariae TaxID=861865 RepID=A0A239FC45_9SPHN|nr:hypothetical protein [Sphingomonas laterariae]SNS53883.1 hypothetical protein SAMN06295912_108147 [Sphingomonas laterariae]
MIAPRWAYETPALLMVARDLHAQRATHYPKAVADGRLSQADAATGIRIAAAIEADWHHVASRTPRAAQPVATKAEKIATLENAVARTRLIAGRAREKLPKVASRYIGDPTELHHLNDAGFFKAHRPLVSAYAHAAEYSLLVETLLWWERKPFCHLFIASLNLAAGRGRNPLPHRAAA